MRALLLAILLAPTVALAGPRLELLIVGPGDDPYTLYGHAAMLVVDEPGEPPPESRVFNFGITDFNRPNYVLDFLTGRVRFWGTQTTYGRALARWERSDRDVWRYPILVSTDAVTRLIARMEHDVDPEHREYVYDTFRDNCATRLRDYLDWLAEGAVRAQLDATPTGRSYRDDVRRAYSQQPALLLLTEIVPGVELDTPRTAWALGYRPEALAAALAGVTVHGRPLLGPARRLHTRRGPDPRGGDPLRGQFFLATLAGLLALLALPVQALSLRWRGAFLALWALISGSVALVLWVVAATSDWPDMQRNWLAACCVPMDFGLLWVAAQMLRGRDAAGRWVRGYLRLRLVTTAVVLGAGPALSALRGPLPPRMIALAGVLVALSCVGFASRNKRTSS